MYRCHYRHCMAVASSQYGNDPLTLSPPALFVLFPHSLSLNTSTLNLQATASTSSLGKLCPAPRSSPVPSPCRGSPPPPSHPNPSR
ncbi:hypothetical protein E2C01_015379 [Portunus trituberculatus]|uniref:Uncharacterized protein n=1 Tax=Portunus trituberculatus TaxID=210409 RepID=A0A5B7DME3_PORTR|nr:hypothetical protein [Portunus trituberculatus]